MADELKEKLTPMQYYVTQQNGTEPAYDNAYWQHHEPGIYVDVVSGEVLFTSLDKFQSHSGWPSFSKPAVAEHLVYREDQTHGLTRIEVRSKQGNSHLGHVFDDGPAPTGKRYCINSAALWFIPREDMAKAGYAQYLSLFEQK